MYLSFLLHLHQPPTQYPRVLKQVVEESYQKIVSLLRRYPAAKLTLNITASLTEQLAKRGYGSLLEELSELARRGRLELTASAAYHPLLTELTVGEIERQIKLNAEINRFYFGNAFNPKGFFPPEMAIDSRVLGVIERLRYKWVAIENQKSKIKNQKFFKCGGLTVVPRNKDISLKIAFAQVRNFNGLQEYTSNQLPITNYHILAMDGETFGHHRPEQLKLLRELFKALVDSESLIVNGEKRTVNREKSPRSRFTVHDLSSYEMVTISELLKLFPPVGEGKVARSTWGKSFNLWRNPKNPVHRRQWQLTNLAIRSVENSKFKAQISKPQRKAKSFKLLTAVLPFALRPLRLSGRYKLTSLDQEKWQAARNLLDRALHSDQYFWASRLPYWHPGMVERGACLLRDTVIAVPDVSSRGKLNAERLCREIIATGRRLYGKRVISL